MPNDSNLILLTGATGYVGGRLLYALETAGYRVRCITRHPKALSQRIAKKTEILKGDVLEAPSLPVGMVGVHTAYYLVHSMASPNSFEKEDAQGAASTPSGGAGKRDIIIQLIIKFSWPHPWC